MQSPPLDNMGIVNEHTLREQQQNAQPPAPVAGTRQLNAWISAVPRLLTLRSRYVVPAPPGPFTLALLWAVAFAVWLFVGWWTAQPDPQFVIYGLPAIAWYAVGALLLAATIAGVSRPPLEFGRALATVLLVAPLVLLLVHAVPTYLDEPWSTAALLAGTSYLIAYLVRGLQAHTGKIQYRAVALAIAVGGVFAWLTGAMYVQPTVWVNEDADESGYYGETWERAEPLIFAQPARIEAALQAIAPGDGADDAYFVGFAGFGEQRVFAEEIKLAQKVMAERFAVASRSVLLLNDQRDLDGAPLASATALRYTLRGIAARMDVERDVLFLSLSSHGAEDWSLVVSNGGLPFNDLTATELAQMLDETGIQWRVIVISACYAGGFIDKLRNARTIVIAAAAKDRTSFGCSDERDLTYFGEAFYRDALPSAASLRDAFEQARASIAERERQEQVTASNPQAHFGNEIERKLAPMMANPPVTARAGT